MIETLLQIGPNIAAIVFAYYLVGIIAFIVVSAVAVMVVTINLVKTHFKN